MIIMEKERQFYFLRYVFRFLFPVVFLFSGFLYGESRVPAEVIEVEGGSFAVTRSGTDLTFPSGDEDRIELFAGDIVKTFRGTELVIKGSSGIVIRLAENSAFFLRPDDYPSPSVSGTQSSSVAVSSGGNMFSGELFYGRARITSSAETGPSVVSVSSFSVFPDQESDFGCDILYVKPEAEDRFPSLNRVACFSGSVTVVQNGGSPAYSSPFVLNEGDMITEGIPGSSVSQVLTALAPVSPEILDFWDISSVTFSLKPEQKFMQEAVAVPEAAVSEAEKEVPSLQEKILPEENAKKGLLSNKRMMRSVSGVMFLSGLVMTGVTMFFYLNDASSNLVEPLAVTSGVLVGTSLVPAVFSLFID